MSRDHLFVLPIDNQKKSMLLNGQQITLDYPSIQGNTGFEVGDRLLLTHMNTHSTVMIIPCAATVIHLNSPKTLKVQQEQSYGREISIGDAARIVGRPVEIGVIRLTPNEFNLITVQMTGTMETQLSEQDFLNHIQQTISARGYYFSDETLKNYHICLKTRPFVILAGLSGTGKSKLPRLYAEAIIGEEVDRYFRREAVRPNWNDDRYLLGYLNTITNQYVPEQTLDFLLDAAKNNDKLYFLCLDEMNLAHVEYYFSQFLSAMEEEPSNRRISLMSEEMYKLSNNKLSETIPRSVIIPENLLFTGTINIDETTQPLSDKVIDRANTIEFFEVNFDKIPEPGPVPPPLGIAASRWRSYVAKDADPAYSQYRSRVREIVKILQMADLGIGYRVLREIELYLANSRGLLPPEVAFDLQVKQRILPRVRGIKTPRFNDMLEELIKLTETHSLSQSKKRLDEMKERLKLHGHTSFWR